MSPWWLLAIEIAFYAAFPICCVLLRPTTRLLYMYLYLALVHLIGGVIGSVHAFTLTSAVSVSAGSVAYGALLMTILLLVMVGHDLSVVRYAVVNVVLTNVFKAGIFFITGYALTHQGFPNRYEIDPQLFSSSLRITVVGGALIILEMLIYLGVFQIARPYLQGTLALAGFHVACYIALLTLDGVLFPLLALSGVVDDVSAVIEAGVVGKLILGIGYSIPFALAIVIFRARIPGLNLPALRVHEVFVAPRDELIDKVVRGEQALAVSNARLAMATDRLDRLGAVRREVSGLDSMSSVTAKLSGLERALRTAGKVEVLGASLIVYSEGLEIASFGARTGGVAQSERSRLAEFGPWIESGDLGDVVCVPVRIEARLAGVIELRAALAESAHLAELVRDLLLELAALLRSDVAASRQRWSDREPIISILESRQAAARFQPIVRLSDRAVIGYEGLIRFEPGISPVERFREAANAGLGAELEILALQTILADAVLLPSGVSLAVNVSPSTILDRRLGGLLTTVDRPVTLELTEHQPIEDYAALNAALDAMPNVQIGVDDAGSGYATLQHVLQLRPAVVKLDMSWVQGVARDKARQALIRAMASFTEEVGATLTAEGIEEEVDAQTLYQLGVVNGQGFLYGYPVAAADL